MSKQPRQRQSRSARAPRGPGRKAVARGGQRRRASLVTWGMVGLLVAAVVAGLAVQSQRSSSGGRAVVVPRVVNGPDDGVLLGRPSAPVLVDEDGDFTCPLCQRFQATMGATIDQLVRQGTIRFNYHPLALLAQNGQDPAQAANATLCVGVVSPASFWELHDALFAEQEPEGAGRWTAQFLVGFGHQQGIGGQAYDRCVTGGTYLGFVDQITQQAQQRGIDATPTIFINGQLQQDPNVLTSPAAFQAAVARALHTSQPDHLVVVVEENHSFEEIIGAPAAPFINHLAAGGTLLTDYHAITHPSLPNYVALLSGRTPIEINCNACTFAGLTLVDQLEASRISWGAYLEGLPRPCSTVAGSGAYTELVDPFMHAAGVRDVPRRCDRVMPFRRFHRDLAGGRLPTVVFVMPDLHHEMHSGPVRVADAWLQRLVDQLRASPVWRQDTRVVVTFDEGARHDVRSCCGGLGRGGRIPTIVAGPQIPQGRDRTPYTHYSLLRSIEAAFGLPFLGHAGDPASATIPQVAGPSRRAA
jgi:phosphatidylinositol-3-phosphatase